MASILMSTKPIRSGKISKIAMICIHSSPVGDIGSRDTGGMSVYIRELARELAGSGISVDIITLCENPSVSRIIPLFKNVRLICLDIKNHHATTKENLYGYLPEVHDEFKRFMHKRKVAYDIIHSHYWISGIFGNQIKKIWNIPHVITFHTLGAVKNNACSLELESDFRIEKEQELAEVCDKVIVSTFNEKKKLKHFYQVLDEKIGIVPAGVDFELFRPSDKTTARTELGLNDNKQLLLYVGRYVPIKGLDRLLKIMPDINHENRFKLIVIGGDDDHEKIDTLIRKLGVQKSVALIGRKNQNLLPRYYNASDMLVMPSYDESFGLVGLESLACGTPVVSTPVGIMPEIIDPKNGIIIKENDGNEMAEAIVHVANIQLEAGYSAEQIRVSVLDYSWKNMARRMMIEYQNCLHCKKTKKDK